MKWIHAGHEYYACVDDDDFEKIKEWVWRSHPKFYFRCSHENDILLHHAILGIPPKDMEIDHINRATWDNRKSNLRLVQKWENQMNKGTPENAPSPSQKLGVPNGSNISSCCLGRKKTAYGRKWKYLE